MAEVSDNDLWGNKFKLEHEILETSPNSKSNSTTMSLHTQRLW